MVEQKKSSILPVNRRRLLQGMTAGGVTGLAGCLDFFFGDDESEGDPSDVIGRRVDVDPDDVVEGDTFRAALSAPPDSFDYPYSSSAEATVLMNLLYEGMITTDAEGELYPWLAESYEQVDVQDVEPTDYEPYMITAEYNEGIPATENQIVVSHPDNDPASGEGQFLTTAESGDAVDDGVYGLHVRFDLHEDIEFHNGEELTAEAVVQSYERIENSPLSGQVHDTLLHVEAEGDYTVHLYTQLPDAAAVREVGGLPVYPTENTDLPPQEMDPRFGNTPLGTGPFVFEEYEDEEYFRATRNDNYWFDTELKDWYDGDESFPNGPAVDEVDVSFVPDDSSRAGAVQNDEIDMTYGLAADTLMDYENSDEYRLSATQAAGYEFMQFPVHVEPWDDPRVRRAVNQLIPREEIAENIYSGWETPAWIPLPELASYEGATDYDELEEELREYSEYDPEAAADLIDEAGVETPIEITLETNSDNDDRVRIVELIAESMDRSELFETTVETDEFNSLIERVLSPDYFEQGTLVFIGLSGGFGPDGYATALHSPDNFGGCCNFQNINVEELNEAMERVRYGVEPTEDLDVRRERMDELWELVLEHNANSYSTHSVNVSVLNEAVKGFNTYPSTQDIIGYGLYNPMDEQITYLDRE